jgi:hypothetical protein
VSGNSEHVNLLPSEPQWLPGPGVVLSVVLVLIHAFSPTAGIAGWDIFTRVGTGTDRLQWNIGSPNVDSELTFRSATTVVGVLGARYYAPAWSIGGDVLYGGITGGTVQDDDFDIDNRPGLSSRSLSAIDGHYVLGLRASVDATLWRKEERGQLWLLTGFRYYEQRFRITNGRQVVSCGCDAVPRLGPLPGLNTMFDARWYGLELGLKGKVRLWDTPLWAHSTITWIPLAAYDARAWWNLREDFQQNPSFKQTALSWGWSLDLGLSYRFTERVEFGGGWRTLQFTTYSSGTETAFFSDGSIGTTTLNEAHSSSNLFYLELTTHF